jgi:hypothetical protein
MPPRVLPNPVVTHEHAALIAPPDPGLDPDLHLSIPRKHFDDRINPRWLRIPVAVRYSGINRSRLFRLIAEGAIKSACLKEHRGAKRGLRLVDRFSLDLHLETLSKPIEERLVAESNELLAQETELNQQQKALAQKRQAVARALAKIRRLEPPEQ